MPIALLGCDRALSADVTSDVRSRGENPAKGLIMMISRRSEWLRRTRVLFSTVTLAVLVNACGAEGMETEEQTLNPTDVGSEPAEELVQKGFLRKVEQSNAEIFTWSANQQDVHMRPVSSHLCFLTRVSGNFNGNSAVWVHRSIFDIHTIVNLLNIFGASGGTVLGDTGTTWKLGGFQFESNSLTGEAVCIPKSNFLLNPGSVTQLSPQSWAMVSNRRPGCSNTARLPLWTNHPINFITGMRGEFEGGGERIEIVSQPWATNPNAVPQFEVSSGQCGEISQVEGAMHAFFAGIPGQTHAMSRVSINPYVLSVDGTTKNTRMGRTRDSACYLTRISGEFDGAEERIRINTVKDSAGVEYWNLEVKGGSGGAGLRRKKVYATAECVAYNQRPGTAPL